MLYRLKIKKFNRINKQVTEKMTQIIQKKHIKTTKKRAPYQLKAKQRVQRVHI